MSPFRRTSATSSNKPGSKIAQEQLARDLNAEERLLEIVAEGKEELEGMAEQVEQQNQLVADLLARFGAYPIVNFQLLKTVHEPDEPTINTWFDESSKRLRDDIENHPLAAPRSRQNETETENEGEVNAAIDPYGATGAGEATSEVLDDADTEEDGDGGSSLVDQLR